MQRRNSSSLSRLQKSEWGISLGLCLFLVSCIFIAHITQPLDQCTPHDLSVSAVCSVTIQGAVKRPGVYRAPLGVSLEKVVRKSRPHAHADLQFLEGSPRVEGSMTIVVNALTIN